MEFLSTLDAVIYFAISNIFFVGLYLYERDKNARLIYGDKKEDNPVQRRIGHTKLLGYDKGKDTLKTSKRQLQNQVSGDTIRL